jgi:hypothetical protein
VRTLSRAAPLQARWFRDHAPPGCIACPGGYTHSPTAERPARCECAVRGASTYADGLPCGYDVGLSSTWEANLRMPAIARWPGRVSAGATSLELVSTLDVLPTARTASHSIASPRMADPGATRRDATRRAPRAR